MALKSVNWVGTECLPCKVGQEVIICVDPAKVPLKTCFEGGSNDQFSYGFIEGTLNSICRTNIISPPTWSYTVSYDNSQLVDGTSLSLVDIQGVWCKGCFVQWVEQIVGDDPYLIDQGEGVVSVVSQHGCQYDFSVSEQVIEPNYLFGDGSDGDLTILTGNDEFLPEMRDFFFENLTIQAGATFRLFGEGVSYPTSNQRELAIVCVRDTLIIDGVIDSSGGSGTPTITFCDSIPFLPAGGRDPGIWQARATHAGVQIRGGCGGIGYNSSGRNRGGESIFSLDFFGVGTANYARGGLYCGGVGGSGGAAGGNGGGGGLSGTLATKYPHQVLATDLVNFNFEAGSFAGGMGGGGGGGGENSGTAIGGGGGGGGAGGAPVIIFAKNIQIGANGVIRSNGGNGGVGGNGTPGGGGDIASGGGGGGGGGGGFIYLVYGSFLNNGVIEVLPGSGGAGGTGVNAPDGESGADGEVGTIVRLDTAVGQIHVS